ncbi:hypothetical protein [Thiocystis violascens]|uniref:Uncharacterized protein n=1 Tax=Thiocystis violascens (strain ATCC 17096 / DSM 198 / 6111) TaxID=765911 RepID=I3Y5J1_THIV6|nr:hypothetical protein [Thiocystis violascens]AFL72259.1 hypothetical protein Thivi_0187 [Thiocystis violascens DSM 198]
MKNPLSQLNTIQIGKPGRVLVLHSDGYRLTAALVQTGVTGATIRARALSLAIDPQVAVAEALEGLRARGVRRLPKKAVLMSASAVTALLDLPVDPEHPRPREQMHELVRWELESLFSEQNLFWTIGAPLMGRGYLTPEQRSAVAERQALQALDAEALPKEAGPRVKARFGDVAVEAELVTRDQVEECVELRDQLFRADDQLVCGWVGQSRPLEEDSDDDEEDARGFSWLALAVPESLRRAWVKACQRQGIFLDTAYAILGAGFVTLEASPGAETLYLEVHPEQFAVMRGRPGALRSLRVGNTRNGRLPPEDAAGLCREELTPEIRQIHLRAPEDQAAELSEALADLLGLEVVRAGDDAALSEPESAPVSLDKGARRFWRARAADTASARPAAAPETPPRDAIADEILAVARHVLGTVPRAALASVAAQPARAPLWKRRDLLPYAAAAAVLMAVLANDVRMRVAIWDNDRELERLDALYEEQLEQKRTANEILAEANRLQAEIAAAERVIADLTGKVTAMERLAARRERLPRVLEQIAAACGDELYLHEIKLPPTPGALVQLRGWALNSTAAQLFVTNLNNTLGELKGTVRNSRIVAGPGPRAISGYQIEVLLAFGESGT